MPDPNQPAPTPTIDQFIKATAPQVAPEPEKQSPTQPAPEGHQEADQTSQAPVPPKEPEPKLATLIREGREARNAREKSDQRVKSLEGELEAAKAQLAKLSKVDLVADPIGWVSAMGLTKEEQALLGETFLYDIVPDRAPKEFRTKLAETREARAKRLAETEAKRVSEEQQRTQVVQVRTEYANALHQGVQKIPEGSYTDSKAWFGENHVSYTQSLLATADNLAEAARARGEMADLSFDAVAKVLEADIKARFDRRMGAKPQKPAAGEQTQQKPAEPATGKQSGETTSTKGLTGAGLPRPPATTDDERRARAMALLEGRI